MQSYSDFEKKLLAFDAEGVSYLFVGAYAVAVHARPRSTGDIDIWVDSSAENARLVYRALAAYGAPMEQVDARTFCEPDIVFQIGLPPIRIDISTIDGVTFGDAWPKRVASMIGTAPVDVIGRLDLIANKRSSARPKDLADLERLERDTGRTL